MKTVKISAYYAILLALIALICTALSTGIYLLTKSKIEDEINKQRQALLLEVVPQAYFDNPLSENCQRPNSENYVLSVLIAFVLPLRIIKNGLCL